MCSFLSDLLLNRTFLQIHVCMSLVMFCTICISMIIKCYLSAYTAEGGHSAFGMKMVVKLKIH